MNLHQPLPSSCYLNTNENATVSKLNLNSPAPKLQKRKQRLHLGAKRVDPALFPMIENKNEKKMFTNVVTNGSGADIGKTYSKSVSSEDEESEEERKVSKDELDLDETIRLERREDNIHIPKHSISLITDSVSRTHCPTKTNEDNTVNSGGYHEKFRNVEPMKPKLNPSSNDEAQKKFGSAKSISSERYFKDISGAEEYRSDLSRFTNSSAISSDELFNREPYESNLQDLFLSSMDNISYEELAVCLRNGVTKVAGKLGSALNNLASRLPHEFGEY